MPAPPVPLTQDLNELLRALDVAGAEFAFQAHRLRTAEAPPKDEQEARYRTLLMEGYDKAAKFARILRRYAAGRQIRTSRRNAPSMDAQRDAISESGAAAPHFGEDQ